LLQVPHTEPASPTSSGAVVNTDVATLRLPRVTAVTDPPPKKSAKSKAFNKSKCVFLQDLADDGGAYDMQP